MNSSSTGRRNIPMIEIDDLEFRYSEGEFVLRIPRLSVAHGAALAITGPSGSGKTTLLHLIAGVVAASKGRIRVGDANISELGDAARRGFRSRAIGMVFQEFELLEYLSVLDNILLPYRISDSLALSEPVKTRARELARRVGIGDRLGRNVRRLSHGERQRVGVCRALLAKPPLVLADEPTGNLDPKNKSVVLDILLEYAAESGATLVTVTHDHDLLPRFDRVFDVRELRDGNPSAEPGRGSAP